MPDPDRPYRSLVPPWTSGPDRLLLDTRIFQIRTHVAASPTTGHQAPFVIMDTADWVNVIARTVRGEVVLVEQFRHGTGEVTVEIPGGMVDPGETPLTAGLRELAEETGYRPGPDSRPKVIGTVASQSGHPVQPLRNHTGGRSGARRATPRSQRGAGRPPGAPTRAGRVGALRIITHALVVAALHHLRLYTE